MVQGATVRRDRYGQPLDHYGRRLDEDGNVIANPKVHRLRWQGAQVNGSNPAQLRIPRNHLWDVVKDEATGQRKIQTRFHPGQVEAWSALAKIIAVIAGTQAGKALALDTPIPTPWGWKTMGTLEVGDWVFDATGAPCRVTRLSPIYLGNQCYRVTFDDGVSVVADAEHLWWTQTGKERKNLARRTGRCGTDPRGGHNALPTSGVRTTAQITATLTQLERGREGTANHSILLCPGPVLAETHLPIPPYTLGAWLGDGTSTAAVITTADDEVLDAILEDGVAVGEGKEANAGRARNYSLGVTVPGRGAIQARNAKGQRVSTGGLRAKLQLLGLLGNKHIPEQYLFASADQRLALLQGLMDTDGNISRKGRGATCEYTTVLPRLASDVATLARSLGLKARVHTKVPTLNGKPCHLAYRVTFTTAHKVFRITRKVRRLPTRVRPDTQERFIVAVEPVPTVPVRCITVDSATETYLCTTAYVPTHNTSFGPLWLWREIKRCGPGDYLAVTATNPLSKLKMLPEFLRLFDHTLRLGKWHKGDRVFEITEAGGMRLYGVPESSRIIFGSAVSPESLESATAKAAWCDEAGQQQFRLESWEAVQRRLALNQGRVLITTTPYNLGWLYTTIYQPWQREEREAQGHPEGKRRFKVIQFPSNLNPSFPDAAMQEARESLPSWRYQLFYEGQFAKPAGLIYSAYTDDYWPNGHLVPRFEIPPDWPLYLGVDFGGANTALVWLTMDPTTAVYYVCGESLSGGKTTKEHVKEEFLPMLQGGNPLYAVCGGAPGETQQRMDWAEAGVPIEQPEVSDLEAQIDRVLLLLRGNRLFVMDHCMGWRSEAGAYSRVLDVDGTPTDKIDDKAKYHRLDATRYIAQKLAMYPLGTNMGMMLMARGVRGPWTRGA